MLRKLFNEPVRQDQGRLLEINELADDMIAQFVQKYKGEMVFKSQRLIAWTKSIVSSFDELEQSVYCASRYADLVKHDYVQDMGPEEEADYRRYLYFYKNGFIRVFSVLDKLGSFANERYALRTERLKERFSYFTVLRRMRETKQHPILWNRLYDIKEQYREPVKDLRLMRNHEVHAMNSELLDEDGRIRLHPRDVKEKIEDLQSNKATLEQGYRMVAESLHAVFLYSKEQ